MNCYTLHDLLRINLERDPAAKALVLGNREVSYEELERECERLSSWISNLGVPRRGRIAIHLPKSIEEVVATFAVARVGAVFVNVNYQWTPAQLAYVLSDCDVDVLITDGRRASQVIETGLCDRLKAVLVRDPAPDHHKVTPWASLTAPGSLRHAPCIDSDLAALMYTSGSTGKPKGVMLTHRNIVQGAQIVSSYLNNTAADRVLGLLPMSFDYGLSQITTMFLVGGAVVLQTVMMPAEIVKTVIGKMVTGVALVPPAWVQLVGYLRENPCDLRSLRYITNTGGKIPQSTLESMSEIFADVEIYLMYGLTEAFRSTYLEPGLFRAKMGSIGRAIPNNEVYVIDVQKGICGPGEQGELIHRGSLISQGYWGNSNATDEKLKVNEHLRPLLGEEKVLHSGDIVRLDEDGYLWFVGRRDTLIKTSGFRLSPTEVEEVLCANRLVAHAVAFGVEDDELGEAVHAIVVPEDGHALNLEEIARHCRQCMPAYMVPRSLHPWPGPVPLTGSGKLDRQTMIATIRHAPSEVP